MSVATRGMVTSHYFDAPAITARAGELLDSATIQENVDFLEPTALFETYNCLLTDVTPVFPCPAVFMAAPVQSASATATTGGTLAAGTYRAKITAINSRGETIASNEQSQVTTGTTSTITWNWAAVTGATGYRVYVTALGGAVGSETFLIQVGAVLTYVWTGTPAQSPANPAPPTTNTAVVVVTKTFLTPTYQDGIRFGVYAGANCKGIGNTLEHEQAEISRVFLANESVGVEKAMIGLALQGAVDLTPAGGAVTPQQGMALLEGHASWNYAGVPTLHAPRGVGSLLSQNNQIQRDGQRFLTAQGSKFASGGGYQVANVSPTNTVPTAGELWMYVSGEVVVARGELIAQTQMNRDTNEIFALVERLYVAAYDCYKSAVRVKVY